MNPRQSDKKRNIIGMTATLIPTPFFSVKNNSISTSKCFADTRDIYYGFIIWEITGALSAQ